MRVQVGVDILAENNRAAEENRQLLARHGVVMLNLMSSPGAGKTTILERTILDLKDRMPLAVIEGDPVSTRDAERIARLGVPAVQLNTRGGCHLDARMVKEALARLDLPRVKLVIVENVGNLVCPAEFDLGEHFRVTVLSTAEGNDKIEKYPTVFRETNLVVVNKLDLLPFTDFDLVEVKTDLAKVNPELPVLNLSAKTGEGFGVWLGWLCSEVEKRNPRRRG